MAFWKRNDSLADLPVELAKAGEQLEKTVETFERDIAKVTLRRQKRGTRITPPPPRRPSLGTRRPHAHPLRPLKRAPLTVLQQRRLQDGVAPPLLSINAARAASALRSGLLGLRDALDRARLRAGGLL